MTKRKKYYFFHNILTSYSVSKKYTFGIIVVIYSGMYQYTISVYFTGLLNNALESGVGHAVNT